MAMLEGEVKRVAEAIMGRIIDGAYPAGLRLPSEAALGEELGCGRSTVREALRHLADMGLVQSRRGSGAMVLDYRREGRPALLPTYLRVAALGDQPARLAREMLRLRTLMATEAVRLAARYASPDEIGPARARLAEAAEMADDPSGHALVELELYRELVLASGIWPAAWMVNAFWQPLREINVMFAPAMGPVARGFQRAMKELLDCVEQGDAERAVAVAQRWFERVDRKLVGVIEQALGAGDGPSRQRREKGGRR